MRRGIAVAPETCTVSRRRVRAPSIIDGRLAPKRVDVSAERE